MEMILNEADQRLVHSVFSKLMTDGPAEEWQLDDMRELCFKIMTNDFCRRRNVRFEDITFDEFSEYLDEMEGER